MTKQTICVRLPAAIHEALRLAAAMQRPPVNRTEIISRAVWEYLGHEAVEDQEIAALLADATAEMTW